MINFGEGGDRRSPAGVADALFGDHIDIRTFKDLHILTHIGGQALQVPALPLCKKNVKGQGGFARTGDTGQHHQLILRNGQVDVLQVVFPGTFQGNCVDSRRGRKTGSRFGHPRWL